MLKPGEIHLFWDAQGQPTISFPNQSAEARLVALKMLGHAVQIVAEQQGRLVVPQAAPPKMTT